MKRGLGRIYRGIYGWEIGWGKLEGRYCGAGSANGEEIEEKNKNEGKLYSLFYISRHKLHTYAADRGDTIAYWSQTYHQYLINLKVRATVYNTPLL